MKGFSLLELSIAMAVLAILASSIVPIGIRSLQIKAVQKTALEISMIQEASFNYYNDHHLWPQHIGILQSEGYLNSKWVSENPWGKAYQIIQEPLVAVSTEIPITWDKLLKSNLPGSSSEISSNDSSFYRIFSPISFTKTLNNIPVGTIIPWPSQNLPSGFLWCNGQLLNISDYPNLAEVINHSYGGDGIKTFALPDMRGRTIVGVNRMGGAGNVNRITQWGDYPSTMGGTFGEDVHALTVEEMPPHQHIAGPAFGDIPNPFGSAGVMRWRVDSKGSGLSSMEGGDHSGFLDSRVVGHNVVQPSIALGYIIKY